MGDLVYSTESGRICPDCGNPVAQCQCKSKSSSEVRGNGGIKVSRETKGRKGKGVTLITGLPLNDLELKFLAKELKQACGTGGTVKEGIIEIQGEQRDTIVKELEKRGYSAKRVGG